MNRYKLFVLMVILLMMFLSGKSQSNLSFYPLENQFNSFNYNPAFLVSQQKANFSILPIGGTSIGYNNQEVINDLVSKTLSGITSDQDYKDILKSMVDHSLINQKIESTLLTFTFLSKVGFFNFQIREIESFSTAVKGDLTGFLFRSGIQSAVINQIQNLPAQAMYYREFSLGYSLSTKSNRLAAGIRTKIYFGKAAFFSGISGQIIPDPTGGYTLKTDGKVMLSFPGENGKIKTASGKTMSYLMNSGNPGIGIDLGINYRILPELSLSMSVTDLGEINWKNNLNSKSFSGQFNFSPESIRYSTTKSGAEIITSTESNNSYLDSISSNLSLDIDSSAFGRPMPVRIYTGLKYQLNPSLKISLINSYVILKNMNYNSFSIMAGFDMNKNLSVSTGYSIIGKSYKNIPLALLFKKDFGQVYIGTDNLLAFIAPSFSDFAGFTFGACFYLFKNKDYFNERSDIFQSYKYRTIKKNKRTGVIRKTYPEF